jgi:bifunctional non-homologous end joining protein LigD
MTDIVWLPTDIDGREAETLIQSPEWCAQEKVDGIRILVGTPGGRLTIQNRRGESHGFPARIKAVLEESLSDFARDSLYDGEYLHAGEIVLFDILQFGSRPLRHLPYLQRWQILTELIEAWPSRVHPVHSAFTIPDKVALIGQIRAEGADGVNFKHLDAPYQAGRPGRSGTWTMRRWKWRKCLECLVSRRADGTRSFEMFLLSSNPESPLVSIGAVSSRHFHDQLDPGAVAIAEISYLYSTPRRRIVQPVMEHWRPDKEPGDCTLDQLVPGGRFAHARPR